MFTGIIEDVGVVKSIEKKGAFGRITVGTALSLDDVKTGDSIAVNGACLTVVGSTKGSFTADVSEETFKVTTLGELKPGSRVNLEKALTLSKPLGGHLVTGHIDGVGVIRSKANRGEYVDLGIDLPGELISQVVKKGSITVDGISLTVADIADNGVRIAIIPHTLKNTTLVDKSVKDRVNIETDIIGKYVEKFFSNSRGAKKGVSESFLEEHGFLRRS